MKRQVILYHSELHAIGGIETFIHNFCKRMSKHVDLLFLFSKGHFENIIEIGKYCDVLAYTGQHLECDTLILASAWGTNPEHTIKCGKQIQMIHADYSVMKKHEWFTYRKGDNTTHHVAVGANAAKAFTEATGYNCDAVIYNLIDLELAKTKRTKRMKLCTFSRLSVEKGFKRIKRMCEMMEEGGIAYEWDVYGDPASVHTSGIMSMLRPHKVTFKGITRDKTVMREYEYTVQLSDTEGLSYSLLESIQQGVPIIITDFPAAHELIQDGTGGYILPMDMEFNIKKITKKPKALKFNEKSTEQDWINIINAQSNPSC